MNKVYSGKHKWFDSDCLKHHDAKGIDWKNSVGCVVEFECRGYHGYYTIHERILRETKGLKRDKYLYNIYFNNDMDNIYTVTLDTLQHVNFVYMLGIFSRDFLYEIGDVINDKFIILERGKKIFSADNNYAEKYYVCKCMSDGYIFECKERELKNRKKCPLCCSYVVIPGVNDIATTRPELVQFLADKNDAFKYSGLSSHELDFICNICNKPFSAKPSKFPVSFPCGCHSTDSYPNRFIKELFNQLNISYISELRKIHFDWCKKYRYDLYFEINNKRYIVEMDGGQHKDEMRASIDKIKNDIAKENDVEVIRIDCDYQDASKRFSHIKNNIIESRLSEIIDLSCVDWDSVNIKTLTTSMVKEVGKLRNSGYSNKEISDMLNISYRSVSSYLDICRKSGIVDTLFKYGEAQRKVMEVVNLSDGSVEYYVGIDDFYKNSVSYVGINVTYGLFKQLENDGHVILNGYDMSKISYNDFLKKTIA